MDAATRPTGQSGHRAAAPSTRTRSGSEAIKKRVARLMQSTLNSSIEAHDDVNPRRFASPESSSTRDARQRLPSKDKPLPVTPSQPRALKKRRSFTGSSDRAENRKSTTSKTPVASSSQQQSSSRVFDAMAQPPDLDHDLLISTIHTKGRVAISKRPPTTCQDNCATGDLARYEQRREDVFRGPLAVAEYDRMKKEIESLKEALQESRKASKRNLKKLEESRAEMNNSVMALKDRESELVDVKGKCKKNEELLSVVESSIQCQICMDLPDKPFALSPCGHILCLTCLQEWFRKAPPTMDDMDIGPDELTDPHYILMRSKSCPSCRALVKRRPVPVFMVKAVASALKKAKVSPVGLSTLSSGDVLGSHPEKDEPWKGIFPSSDDDSDEPDSPEEYGFFESDFEDSERPRILQEVFRQREHPRFGNSMFGGLDSSSESEPDEESEEELEVADDSEEEDDQTYVPPSWAPPSVEIQPDDPRLIWRGDSQESLKLLQRGCNFGMLQNFDISYSHQSGIIVSLHSLDQLYASDSDHDGSDDIYPSGMNRIFLGWNITLRDYDVDGETYLGDVLEDIKNNPSRWLVHPRPGIRGAKDAKRLVCPREGESYDTTDSEVWVDAEIF